MQDFRRLFVWRRGHALAIRVHRAAKRFPRSGYAALRSQITRSAESIPTNVVEGCGAATNKEFARFLDISIKSATELEYQLLLARDYEILPHDEVRVLTAETIEIRKMLFGLRASVLAPDLSRSISH